MKSIILIPLFCLSLSIELRSQNDLDYFVTQTKDTVYGAELKYGTGTWGALNFLSYIRADGSPVVYKSKKSAPTVLTLNIDGKTIDKIPLKPNSKREVRYLERTIDGHLIVYLQHQKNSNYNDGTVMYIFYLKMPNGKFYKINSNKNMKNVIIPYLNECNAFINNYDGEYSNKEEPFMEMIQLYNSLCPSTQVSK